MYVLWTGCNNTNNQERIRGKLSMGFGGVISFLIFEKIEQIIKEKGVEAYGIEKFIVKRALQFSMLKMEQTVLSE